MGGCLSYEFRRSAAGMVGSIRRKEFISATPSCSATANMPPPPTTTSVPGRTVVLPDDMILEVLTRLPVKSILRFRAVCRSWAALFSSKDFCSLHMATSKALPREPKLLLLSLQSRLGSTEVYSCSLPGPGDDLLFTLDRAPHKSLEVVTPSTCCGLSLFFDYVTRDYYVCNAATRGIKRLPPYRHPTEYHSVGLGFDAQTMEYKVVRLVMSSGVMCGVYTPGADRWRSAAGEVPFELLGFAYSAINHASSNDIPPVFGNGFLHWLISPNLHRARPAAAILLFSVAEETFGSVASPPFWGPTESERPWSQARGEHLAVMDDQVCIVRDLCDRYPTVSGVLEIWGLLDYGSGDWSMNLQIDLSGHIGRQLGESHFLRIIGLVGTCRSGKRVVIAIREHYLGRRFQEKVYTYDPRCQVIQDIRSVTENARLNPGPRFSLFEESLALVHKSEENACPSIYPF